MIEGLMVGLLILVISVQIETRVKLARTDQRLLDHLAKTDGHQVKTDRRT